MFQGTNKTQGKILMYEYKFLHDYLRELRLRKYEARRLKKNSSKSSLKNMSMGNLRKTKSMFLNGENVDPVPSAGG